MVKQTDRQNRVVCLMVVMVAAALSVASPSPSCNTHCPDPYLNLPGHYVCCDQHPGKCPPVPHCPAYPRKCFYDPECGLNEKCCNTPCGGKRCISIPYSGK
uniref:Type I crustin 3 n=1 Tax=Scylla paramamosain TaxID=85552 RepID=A0A2K9UW22_SCYPA|nr:type I crustin 3 [Scylla paramamosain]